MEQKVARHRNHVGVNLRCRDKELIPTSIWGKSIVAKASKNLLKERIRVINNKLVNLKRDLEKEKTGCLYGYLAIMKRSEWP